MGAENSAFIRLSELLGSGSLCSAGLRLEMQFNFRRARS